mmetsp:Transcript_36298/g.95703  ORF Transcript_36298/g.95703 Transcript_36298/m.95703 type:complete len:565 (+) Transcript_36298:77-1771(+)
MESGARGSLRPNYSCGSLAAAEQLEALMHHPPTPTADALARQQQRPAMYGGALPAGMYGLNHHGTATPQADHQQSSNGLQMPYGDTGGFMGSMDRMSGMERMAALERMDQFSQAYPSTMGSMLMRNGGFSEAAMSSAMHHHQVASLAAAAAQMGGGSGGGGYYPTGQGACGVMDDDGSAARSSLSLLHSAAGAYGIDRSRGPAQGGGPPMGGGQLTMHGSMGGHVGGAGLAHGRQSPTPPSDPAQKRRFVWTPELHQRFEAAVNALGLDIAKPKTILKLMSVDGLTKANIKSHLQKYRCLMAKRASEAASKTGEGSGSAAGGSSALSGMGIVPNKPGSSNGSVDSRSTAALDAEGGTAGAAGEAGEGEDPTSQLDLEGSKTSLHKNLEVQEMTLQVQMELQKELSRQLELQKTLQSEMESLMNTQHLEARDLGTNNSKMGSILALKDKLQTDLKEHLRMQHQLLSQLNHVVLPAVERLDTQEAADIDAEGKKRALAQTKAASAPAPAAVAEEPCKTEAEVESVVDALAEPASVPTSGAGVASSADEDDDDDDEEEPPPKKGSKK